MRFEKYLIEKFDLNYPLETFKTMPTQFHTEFSVGDDKYKFRATKYNMENDFSEDEIEPEFDHIKNAWELEFAAMDKDDAFAITGDMRGKAQQVFSGVLTSTKEFIKRKKPEAFYFTGKAPSRFKLYDHLSRAMMKKIPGYKYKQLDLEFRDPTFFFYK